MAATWDRICRRTRSRHVRGKGHIDFSPAPRIAATTGYVLLGMVIEGDWSALCDYLNDVFFKPLDSSKRPYYVQNIGSSFASGYSRSPDRKCSMTYLSLTPILRGAFCPRSAIW
jgi:hypothetical protein